MGRVGSMNSIIEALLLQIATMCLHITQNGQVKASCDITGHTASVYIKVFKGDTDFTSEDGIRAGTVLRLDAPYDLTRYDWLTPTEQHAQCEQGLKSVIEHLMPYLQPEQQVAA